MKIASGKIAAGLTLIIIGAILAFAVTTNTSVFNLHIAGFVFILAGLAAMLIPQKNYSSVSKRLVTRRSRTWPSGRVTSTQEVEVPPYVMINPGSSLIETEAPMEPSVPPDPTVRAVMTPGELPVESETVQQLRDE
jgi:uncharacterized protein YjeT (DUF2065 family)